MTNEELGKLMVALKRENERLTKRVETLEQNDVDQVEAITSIAQAQAKTNQRVTDLRDEVLPRSHEMRPYDIQKAVEAQEKEERDLFKRR